MHVVKDIFLIGWWKEVELNLEHENVTEGRKRYSFDIQLNNKGMNDTVGIYHV